MARTPCKHPALPGAVVASLLPAHSFPLVRNDTYSPAHFHPLSGNDTLNAALCLGRSGASARLHLSAALCPPRWPLISREILSEVSREICFAAAPRKVHAGQVAGLSVSTTRAPAHFRLLVGNDTLQVHAVSCRAGLQRYSAGHSHPTLAVG